MGNHLQWVVLPANMSKVLHLATYETQQHMQATEANPMALYNTPCPNKSHRISQHSHIYQTKMAPKHWAHTPLSMPTCCTLQYRYMHIMLYAAMFLTCAARTG
jgi:hypothetical protein